MQDPQSTPQLRSDKKKVKDFIIKRQCLFRSNTQNEKDQQDQQYLKAESLSNLPEFQINKVGNIRQLKEKQQQNRPKSAGLKPSQDGSNLISNPENNQGPPSQRITTKKGNIFQINGRKSNNNIVQKQQSNEDLYIMDQVFEKKLSSNNALSQNTVQDIFGKKNSNNQVNAYQTPQLNRGKKNSEKDMVNSEGKDQPEKKGQVEKNNDKTYMKINKNNLQSGFNRQYYKKKYNPKPFQQNLNLNINMISSKSITSPNDPDKSVTSNNNEKVECFTANKLSPRDKNDTSFGQQQQQNNQNNQKISISSNTTPRHHMIKNKIYNNQAKKLIKKNTFSTKNSRLSDASQQSIQQQDEEQKNQQNKQQDSSQTTLNLKRTTTNNSNGSGATKCLKYNNSSSNNNSLNTSHNHSMEQQGSQKKIISSSKSKLPPRRFSNSKQNSQASSQNNSFSQENSQSNKKIVRKISGTSDGKQLSSSKKIRPTSPRNGAPPIPKIFNYMDLSNQQQKQQQQQQQQQQKKKLNQQQQSPSSIKSNQSPIKQLICKKKRLQLKQKKQKFNLLQSNNSDDNNLNSSGENRNSNSELSCSISNCSCSNNHNYDNKEGEDDMILEPKYQLQEDQPKKKSLTQDVQQFLDLTTIQQQSQSSFNDLNQATKYDQNVAQQQQQQNPISEDIPESNSQGFILGNKSMNSMVLSSVDENQDKNNSIFQISSSQNDSQNLKKQQSLNNNNTLQQENEEKQQQQFQKNQTPQNKNIDQENDDNKFQSVQQMLQNKLNGINNNNSDIEQQKLNEFQAKKQELMNKLNGVSNENFDKKNNEKINSQQQLQSGNALKSENDLTSESQFEKSEVIEFTMEEFAQSRQSGSSTQKEEIHGKIIQWVNPKLVGSGSFGSVFIAQKYETNETIAIKRLNVAGIIEQEMQVINNEISIMKNVDHQHVVKYLGHEQLEDKYLYIYMEYMKGGSLKDFIQDQKETLDEKIVKKFCREMLLGLEYLHSQKIVHKDIKCANILIDQNQNLKLADFGNSKLLEESINSIKTARGMMGICGSIPWMAPEVMLNKGFKKSADIWSFGCTIIELITFKTPWKEENFQDLIGYYKVIGATEKIPQIPDFASEELKQFILRCLKRDKKQRATAKELLQDPFIQI